MSTFLVEAFRSPDPSQDGRQVKVADVLDRASERLDKEFAGSQATKGALLDALGQTYQGLGLYDQAVSLHTKARAVREAALGPDHPDTLASRNNLAIAYRSPAGWPRRSRCTRRRSSCARPAGPRPPRHAQSRNNLAIAYDCAGRTAEAIALHEATLKLARPSWAPTTPTRSRAATTWPTPTWRRPAAEAIALHEATLEAQRGEAGPRPSRHAHEPQQPGRRLPGAGRTCRRRSRCTRRRSSCCEAEAGPPTTPTRS